MRKVPRMKLKVADAQHTIIFINVVRLTYLSSADAALSPVEVSDIEISG